MSHFAFVFFFLMNQLFKLTEGKTHIFIQLTYFKSSLNSNINAAKKQIARIKKK